jgi:hypothetical protein
VDWAGEGAGGGGLLVCGLEGWVPFARAWASHASRVLWSTGQAAAGSSWEDIVAELVTGRCWIWNSDGGGSCPKKFRDATAFDWLAAGKQCFGRKLFTASEGQ